jgi:hypothetical protein
MSLDALQSAQEEDLLTLKLFRQLWLYVGVYDFAGLQSPGQNGGNGPGGGDRWPAEWRGALGRVAVATPLLIVGWEQFKPDEMLDSLASEFASRLTKLGLQGAPPALMAALQASLGGALGPQLPGPLVGWAAGRWGNMHDGRKQLSTTSCTPCGTVLALVPMTPVPPRPYRLAPFPP